MVQWIILENGPPDPLDPRPDVEPAVNRQPGFRRELAEQNQHLFTFHY